MSKYAFFANGASGQTDDPRELGKWLTNNPGAAIFVNTDYMMAQAATARQLFHFDLLKEGADPESTAEALEMFDQVVKILVGVMLMGTEQVKQYQKQAGD